MSIATIRSVICDRGVARDCRGWAFQSAATAATLRQRARRAGWQAGLPGGEDVCPACLSHVASGDAPKAIIVL